MFSTKPPLILIVDDEPSNLAMMREILGDQYRLVYAKNGASTLAAAEKHNLSLILLDINLPDMDGYEVCKQLKGNPNTEQIPIIFVTAMNSNQDEEIGLKAGAVDYITKPFSPAIVLARVRIHLSLVKTETLEESYRDAIYMLGAAGHYNDNDTGVHIWRMAAYAARLADECGWGLKSKLLELAAPMHDTGKIGIPNAILRKPAPLTPDEWVIMKTHPKWVMKFLVEVVHLYLKWQQKLLFTIMKNGMVVVIHKDLAEKKYLNQRVLWLLLMFSMR